MCILIQWNTLAACVCEHILHVYIYMCIFIQWNTPILKVFLYTSDIYTYIWFVYIYTSYVYTYIWSVHIYLMCTHTHILNVHIHLICIYIHTARSREDETRNGHWNTKQNPRCSSQVSFHKAHLKKDINFHHRGFRFVFRWPSRVSSSRERTVCMRLVWKYSLNICMIW